jgi:hypothetical protein
MTPKGTEMWSAFLTLLLIITAVLLFVSRHSIRQLKAGAGEAYRNGFMAGHVQGWHDATMAAPLQPQVTAQAATPAPAGPALGWPEFPVAPAPAPALAQEQPLSAVPALMPDWAPAAPAQQPFTHLPMPVRPNDGAAFEEPALAGAPPEESPAELLARKEKRERQNINVTLYVASLLLVAAGALFVGTSLPAGLRFAGVCLITVFFYGAGFALHAKVPRLRPAAVAFTGTGLALVPVAGLAMYYFAVQDGPLAWLLTSVVGTLAYVAAAIRLESRVLAYLSLTFVVSTAWSGVSVLGASLVWYFAAMIGFEAALGSAPVPAPRYAP